MSEFLAFGIVGLATAAVYAIIGSGLVLTYVTTGTFNFAQGAAGMLAAFAYWQLTVGWGWPVPVALAVVLLVLAPAFGLGIERVVMRPISHLGETERVVVTVSLLSGMIACANAIWNPSVSRSLTPFLSSRAPIRLGPVMISWHQAITMIVAILVAAGLRVLLYRTRAGTEMRATVDDRQLTSLNGGDPVRAARVAWVLSTQLAAVAGILIAPTVTLDSSQLSLLIVSAYTAAIFGRLRSLPMTFAGAVVVGCMESYLNGYLPQNSYLPGLRLAASPLLLLVALLVFRQRQLPGRNRKLHPIRVPTLRGTAVFAAAIAAAGVVLATVLSPADLLTYGPMFSLGLVALSFVPLTGYAGQISLCQLSMAGIGALVWAHLGATGAVWALIAAIAVPAVVGAVIAIPALRLSGIYVALATTAFAIVLDYWVFALPQFRVLGVQVSLFNQGAVNVFGPSLSGHHLTSQRGLMVLAAACLALASGAVALLRRSRYGRRLIALRDSESAYAMLSGTPLTAKLAVFSISAGIAGLGGALYAMQQGSITAQQFQYTAGLPLFLLAVVGGLGSAGTGVFTGESFIGATAATNAVLPWMANLTPIFPGLTGIGLGSNPTGVIPLMRQRLASTGRSRPAIAILVAGTLTAWILRLAGVINGWGLTGAFLIVFVMARLVSRDEPQASKDAAAEGECAEPVEWWGLRRDWRPEDAEALDRELARG
jgi:branched-chain amino acid transport system permease protein